MATTILETANQRYQRTWEEYTRLLQRGQVRTLSKVCDELHTCYGGMKHWMMAQGLKVRDAKRSHDSGQALDTPPAPTFLRVIPTVDSGTPDEKIMKGVRIKFSDGVELSIEESRAEEVLSLMEVYRKRQEARGGSPCSA